MRDTYGHEPFDVDDFAYDGYAYEADAYDGHAYEADAAGLFDTVGARGLDDGFFALELDLLELPCIQESAIVCTELPEVGEAVLAVYVPLSPELEIAGRRAVLAACERRLPGLFSHAVAQDDIPRSVEGAVREDLLLDRVLPQVARDLMSPAAMSD
ncbi:hypothetical protein QMZ92_02505 [Streptomyces sp. HNM0645]|uniref:hypothetical protein n=1 Tax=Streptomyces sp. HNM0645 TaxID=2782343 RepID=UPI0024B74425|nr:hypothetical protein [Streptomyces sp. HNM0645]MDI9883301.1 hypothetical protein [Streptomyces sp. HNM0645]